MIGINAYAHRVLAAAATAITVAGLGCHSGNGPTDIAGPFGADEPAAVVVISDAPAEFLPKVVTVKAGATVEWRNTGGISHSVEFLSEDAPEGMASSHSRLLAPHQTYTRTFGVPGTYTYACRFHCINGMVGKIVVVADQRVPKAAAESR